jgi:DNA-directed RNA polymerase specialized sigma24 family protein
MELPGVKKLVSVYPPNSLHGPMNRSLPGLDASGAPSGFGSTEWSLVLAAGREEDSSKALNSLCRKYWRPMYVHVRRAGIQPADAEDVTQGFFVFLIEKGWISQADPERGSFRAFLRTLLNNYVSNHQRTARAGKRMAPLVSVDTAEGEKALADVSARGKDPVSAFDALWAKTVLRVAWDRLEKEQAAADRTKQFNALRAFVTNPAVSGDYERIGLVLGMRPSQIAVTIHRLSRRYAELIRAEVAETLADRSELESELRHLLLLSSS